MMRSAQQGIELLQLQKTKEANVTETKPQNEANKQKTHKYSACIKAAALKL